MVRGLKLATSKGSNSNEVDYMGIGYSSVAGIRMSKALAISASVIITLTIGCFVYIGIIINDIGDLQENIRQGMTEFKVIDLTALH
ncbi:unnamed protein product [Heligmosomoides polygyrus]|uniref:Col_cuticle_N domain-containing protein n=1 Tax=Heligmosomoides polygyrus TaxID=6339 RepID=A0A183GA19_HELPZ|nr:unnamed protein product [Heligmosomoides polygyrus]